MAAQSAPAAIVGPVLSVRDLTVEVHGIGVLGHTPTKAQRIVDQVTFEVAAGEALSIVGESGSGKTTLVRAVTRLMPSEGAIAVDGIDFRSVKGRELRRVRKLMQLVPQDPLGALDPRRSIGSAIAEPLYVHRLVRQRNIPHRVAELLDAVGLTASQALRHPHELSGGQLKRACLARALATDPLLLIADEPTAGLDVSVQAQILDLITDLQRNRNLALLLISHDLSVVRQVSSRIGVMYLGKLVELGIAATLYESPQHPYTRALLDAVPTVSLSSGRAFVSRGRAIPGEVPGIFARPLGCPFHPRCPYATELCRAQEPQLGAVSEAYLVACHELPFQDGLSHRPPLTRSAALSSGDG